MIIRLRHNNENFCQDENKMHKSTKESSEKAISNSHKRYKQFAVSYMSNECVQFPLKISLVSVNSIELSNEM